MVMVSKFSNFPDKLSENDELREFELSRSDCRLLDKGQIQDLVKGGPNFFWPIFANSIQQSCVNDVSPYWPGSRACLKTLEALGFFITKYAFSPFWGTFLYYF